MTARNKRKLATLKRLNKENCEEYPRSSLAQNSNAPRSQEDYITEISEETVGRVTNVLLKDFSRTDNLIMDALARLNDSFMNPLLQGHPGTTPELSRNALSTSQGTNEDDSQNDPHPEAGLFHGQMTQNSRPEDGHNMVTGATEQIGNCHDMTGVHEEVTYCPPRTSSGKQKKNHSTSQPQFRSENTPATIEADQSLLAVQHLTKKQQFFELS